MYKQLLINEVRNTYYKFTKAEQIDIARNANVNRNQDFIWCYLRDAECYAEITVAGRRYINKLMTSGYDYEPLEMCVDRFYGRQLVDINRSAHFWHIIFSPMAENETVQKVWIKFPDTNSLVWFFIEDYNEKDGFILSPNPRMKYTIKWFDKFDGEFEALVRENPKSIAYALNMCDEFFERKGVRRPSDSYECIHTAMLVHPFPERKSGDGTNHHLHIFSQDVDVPYM